MSKDNIQRYFKNDDMDKLYNYPSSYSSIRYYHRLKASIIIKFIRENAGLNKTILDIGAGRGQYCLYASNLFQKVFFDELDLSETEKAREFMRDKATNIVYKNNSITSTDYPDNYFDIIICSEVLEHVPQRELAIKELMRILKPSGRILISMPQRKSLFYSNARRVHKTLLNKDETTMDFSEWEFAQHFKFSSTDIEKLFTSEGFIINKRMGANVLPPGEKLLKKIIYSNYFIAWVFFSIETALECCIPKFASFYFLELTKK